MEADKRTAGRGRARGRARPNQPTRPDDGYAMRPGAVEESEGQMSAADLQSFAPQLSQETQAEPKRTPFGTGRARGRASRKEQTVQGSSAATCPGPVKVTGSFKVNQPAGYQETLPGKVPTGDGKPGGACSTRYIEPSVEEPSWDKIGTTGDKCSLIVNMVKVTYGQKCAIFQHHVKFSPEVPSKKMRIDLILSQKSVLGSAIITDGMLLFLPKRLSDEECRFTVIRESDGKSIDVYISFSNEVVDVNTILHLLNILFKRVLQHVGLRIMQKHFFCPQSAVEVPEHKLEIWPGYATAIGLYERGISLVADVSHKIISLQTVWDYMKAALNVIKQNRRMDEFKDAMLKELVGQIVMTRYNNRTYRINDIAWNKNPTDCFAKRDGSELSFVQYYKSSYNLTINDERQPLLISLPKKRDRRAGQDQPICLVPELCVLTGIPVGMRTNFRIMQDLAKFTRIGPSERMSRLAKLLRDTDVNPSANKELSDWNVTLDSNMTRVNGRLLPQETVTMHQAKKLQYDRLRADWSKDVRSVNLVDPISLRHEQWIFIFPEDVMRLAESIYQCLVKVGEPMGMHFEQPKILAFSTRGRPTASDYITALKPSITAGTKMVLVLLKSSDKRVYDAVKKLLCVEEGVPSQCLLEKKCQNRTTLHSVMTKVAIQMNCKMGGDIWHVSIPMSQLMVVGVDTYHDSECRQRSAVGMVASFNQSLTKYYTKTFLQSRQEELGKGLSDGLTACLSYYKLVNGSLPPRIIIYRDGVGDGMLETVKSYEIAQFHQSFRTISVKFGCNYNPQLSVVIVKKRILTRIFARDAEHIQNPQPGTVVDDHATIPSWFDFFLVSQAVTQGSVSPTHYNVVENGGFLTADRMQMLTYKLCHLYYNWPGTIRVPAPCQYAHKVAFLVGQSLHQKPDDKLCDTLYYL